MARIADENKLEAIKAATRNIVVMEGISSASISRIAAKANVSAGYLYRYYSGKKELLDSLFQESLEVTQNLLSTYADNKSSIKETITAFTSHLFEVAVKNIEVISFQHRLLSDYSFEIPEQTIKDMRKLINSIVEWGQQTGEINKNITAEHFYLIAIGGILDWINIRKRGFFNNDAFSKKDVEKQITFILTTLR